MIHEERIEVNISIPCRNILLDPIHTQADPFDGDLPQLHLIAGQGPCLVAEDVVNLSQILIQIGIPGFCMLISFSVVPGTANCHC